MATKTDTSKLAPRILVNEHDIEQKKTRVWKHPTTLIFGFSPIGRTCEMVVCNHVNDITKEFGYPTTAPEKYFIDAGLKVIQNGATAVMTRLPYDNAQSHTVKYVDYKVETPISMRDIATIPAETKTRKKDDIAVTLLKEMHGIDERMTQVQRISQVFNDAGEAIGRITNEKLVETELDPQANLEENTFRIVDIRGQQYGIGAKRLEYTGIFPIITTAPMALYYQGKIKNSTELDACLALIDLEEGIQMDTDWFKKSDPVDERTKLAQAEIIAGIEQEINFDTKLNKFHRANSFQDDCVKRFPRINLMKPGMLEKKHLNEIGVLVCGISWDEDTQTTYLRILESFVGKLGRTKGSIDRKINSSSQYIRMYKNLKVSGETDFFVLDNQKITSLGMNYEECEKYINYKTSIVDPVAYLLESIYSDVDSLQIDTILDAGLSATAFATYVARTSSGETYATNPEVRAKVDWMAHEYNPDDYVETYANVWNQITSLFGDFCKNVRGDCVYIADGPRILNLEKNYPIRNYTDLTNEEMFNKYLPLFNGNTNNYVARYWNWVYIEDLQYVNKGFWVPGSVVMGGQLAQNDMIAKPWHAPAGQTRGLVAEAYDVSVKTKQYNQENDLLYSNQWNFFNIYQNEGVVVEGQKTLQTRQTSLDRLNTRRMVCWIKQRAREIANKYKYEPNTRTNRTSFVKDLNNMLSEIQKTSGISDFQILCDDTNNTTETIDRHELWCKIAIKPIKASEYIIIDISVLNGNVGMGESNQVVKQS